VRPQYVQHEELDPVPFTATSTCASEVCDLALRVRPGRLSDIKAGVGLRSSGKHMERARIPEAPRAEHAMMKVTNCVGCSSEASHSRRLGYIQWGDREMLPIGAMHGRVTQCMVHYGAHAACAHSN